MVKLARIEGDEVVIRVQLAVLDGAASFSGLRVTDPAKLGPHFVSELNSQGQDEELYLNKVLDAALVRCAESAAPGIEFVDEVTAP